MMLPVLGLDFLREQRKPKETTGQPVAEPETSPLFSMEIAKHGIRAQAQEVDGEFYVLAGCRARDQWTSSYASYQALHQQLTEDGVLVANEAGSVTFTKDQAFSSPSAAAAVVSGRPANGRTTWKIDDDGLTYGEWQSEQVNAAVEETKSDG